MSSRRLRSSAAAWAVLGAPLVTGVERIPAGVVDRVALLVDDVVEFGLDLVVHATEIAVLQASLTLLTEPFEQLADALQLLAVAVAHPLLHHPSQRRVDVAVIEEFVGELVEGRVGVELETGLGAVPT
jgi:hypothetical protein